ncbi:MAG: response regulator [Thermodesulfobacteriota bacterium]
MITLDGIFNREDAFINKALSLLAESAVAPNEWPVHYSELLDEYLRLVRQTKRIVKISDTMQRQLATLNDQIREQGDALEKANEARQRFLAMISHDIRTPLSAVVGLARLLSHSGLSEDQADCIKDIERSAESLQRLFSDFLDLSRMEVMKLALVSSRFDLWDCVGDSLRSVSIGARERSVEVIGFIDRAVPRWVEGDAGRLRQVIENLLSNSVKFTRDGHIVVRVRVMEPLDTTIMLGFSVADTGAGIPRDMLDRVFGEFEQAHNVLADRHLGAGLGLSISSRLVRMMGGSICLESELDKGTTVSFGVRLEVSAEDAAFDHSAEYRRLAGLKVLVVEHHPVAGGILSEFLAQWGMDPTLVPDIETALEEVRKSRSLERAFDVALLDSSLPKWPELFSQDQPEGAPLPTHCAVVLLSGAGSLTADRLVTSSHRVSQIRKPVKHAELLRAILRAVHALSEDRPSSRAGSFAGSTPLGRKLRVLVADDVPVNRKITGFSLQRLGAEPVFAHDGSEAVELTRSQEFDLILMDVEMPLMDGIEAAKKIREHEAASGKRTPILFMTAHSSDMWSERFGTVDIDGTLPKPVNPAVLSEALERLPPRR